MFKNIIIAFLFGMLTMQFSYATFSSTDYHMIERELRTISKELASINRTLERLPARF